MPVRVHLRIIIGLTSEEYLFAYQKDLKENSSARASTPTHYYRVDERGIPVCVSEGSEGELQCPCEYTYALL